MAAGMGGILVPGRIEWTSSITTELKSEEWVRDPRRPCRRDEEGKPSPVYFEAVLPARARRSSSILASSSN